MFIYIFLFIFYFIIKIYLIVSINMYSILVSKAKSSYWSQQRQIYIKGPTYNYLT
jgi:hypothetical protein